jgi:hypothetical protein
MARPFKPYVDTIQTAKGSVHALLEPIYQGRALILVRSDPPRRSASFSPGSVFIRNYELERRTDGDTEWMAYPGGLYEAWRVGGYIERNANGLSDGEFCELLRERDAARDYVGMILGPEFLDPDARAKHLQAFNEAAAHLGTARDVRKHMAFIHFNRAAKAKDATGRHNPGAAAMAAGAGIGRLMEREDELGFIVRRVGLRTFHVFRAIQRSMAVYGALRWHLNRNKRGKEPHKLRLVMLLDQGDKNRARSAVEDLEAGLKTLHAEPFRKNKFHALRDLESVSVAINALGTRRDASAKRDIEIALKRLHQGTAWVFARDFLEMQIIAPLSWLLKDIERARRSKNAANRSNGASRRDAPDKFDALTERIRDFRRRVDLCEDDFLKHPVKSEVMAHAEEALEYILNQDDWKSAKEELEIVSGLL